MKNAPSIDGNKEQIQCGATEERGRTIDPADNQADALQGDDDVGEAGDDMETDDDVKAVDVNVADDAKPAEKRVKSEKKTFSWSQNSDSSAFLTPPQYDREEPPFPKKRKATYGSFVAGLKKRKVEVSKRNIKVEQKGKPKSRGKKRIAKSDPDTQVCVKAEDDDALQIVPVGNMRPKDKYLFLMRQFVPHVEVAFNELSIVRSTAIAYLTTFDSLIDDNDLSVVHLTVMFEKMLFVRLPDELKEKWATEEGKRASELRRLVMRSCLTMARKNLFGDFVARAVDDANNVDLVDDDNGNPVLPIWLLMTETPRKGKKTRTESDKMSKKGNDDKKDAVKYSINAKSVFETVSRNEVLKKPKTDYNERNKIVKRTYPKRQEMAYYALNYLYHALLKSFTRTRRSAKMAFFNSVGYLFMNWKSYDECEVKDSDVQLRWAAPFGESALGTWDVNLIEASETYKENTLSVDNGNVAAYERFGRAASDVVLLASHDVFVRDDKSDCGTNESGQRRRAGNEKRSWKKAINLMDVVLRVLECLCGFPSWFPSHDILRAHEYSIPLLYTLARTLRKILSMVPSRHIQDGPPADSAKCTGEADTKFAGDKDRASEDDVTRTGEAGEPFHGVDACDDGDDGDPSSHSAVTGSTTAREGVHADAEKDTGGEHDRCVEEEHAAKFMALFMTDEIASAFNLRQATCTIDDNVYWAEHIGGSNESTTRFAHITLGAREKTEETDMDSDESKNVEGGVVDPESEEEEEDNFGF